MRRSLLLFAFGALFMALALPASAQQRVIEPATVAPEEALEARDFRSLAEARVQIDEGFTYGMHNRPGATDDCFGSFEAAFPFEASCTESYPASAFAGTIAGNDLFYYVIQTDTTAAVDSLYAYDFDNATEVGDPIGITYFTLEGDEVPADSQLAVIPQWVDGGIDTETGELVLLGRAGACTAEQGAELWSLNLASGVANEILRFQDPNNCPLSGAYDNENGRYLGMSPDDPSGIYQTDLTDGSTAAQIPLPDDLFQDAIAGFIQGGSTNFFLNDDPSDNEMWLFLFEGVNPNLAATARLAQFDGDGLVTELLNFGTIDEDFDWVEVLATGFPNNAPEPAVANEGGIATPGSFEFVGVYPNPFRAAATVMLRADESAENVTVKAYDVLGRQVAVLHDGPLAANTHHFGLEASNLPSGVYFINVRAGDFAQTKKVVLID